MLSANAISVPTSSAYSFTTAETSAMGSQQLAPVGTHYALWMGNMDSDGVIHVNDFNVYINETSTSNVYSPADVNLDGLVNSIDIASYLPNASRFGVRSIRY